MAGLLNTWLHRTQNQFLQQISSGGMEDQFSPELFHDGSGEPTSSTNWIHAPDLAAVTGFAVKYWIRQPFPDDTVTLMDQSARDAVDAAELSAQRNAIVDQLDQVEDIQRASLLSLLDELNNHADRINAILDAIDGASNLSQVKSAIAVINDYPQRTIAQMKTAILSKLGT